MQRRTASRLYNWKYKPPSPLTSVVRWLKRMRSTIDARRVSLPTLASMADSVSLPQAVASFHLGPRHKSTLANFFVSFCVFRGESSSRLETDKELDATI